MQVYRYYQLFPDDNRFYKYFVAIVWLFELGHSISVSYEVYTATTSEVIITRFIGLGTALILSAAITTAVQTFFSFRVFKLLPRPFNYVGLLGMFLAFWRCVGSIVLGRSAILTSDVVGWREGWFWLITTLFVSGATLDVVIAISMVLFLADKRQAVLSGAARVLDKLTAFTVRTGLLTSMAAVTVLICYLTMPENFIWMAAYTILAKLYSNSLMASLNSREGLRGALHASPLAESSSQSSWKRGIELRSAKRNVEQTSRSGVRTELDITNNSDSERKETWDTAQAEEYVLPEKMV